MPYSHFFLLFSTRAPFQIQTAAFFSLSHVFFLPFTDIEYVFALRVPIHTLSISTNKSINMQEVCMFVSLCSDWVSVFCVVWFKFIPSKLVKSSCFSLILIDGITHFRRHFLSFVRYRYWCQSHVFLAKVKKEMERKKPLSSNHFEWEKMFENTLNLHWVCHLFSLFRNLFIELVVAKGDFIQVFHRIEIDIFFLFLIFN